jgi:hypothetical protein
MARVAALILVGVLLVVAVVYFVSKISDGLRGKGGTVWNIVLLMVIAAVAFWFFGEGMVFEYLNK